MNRSWPHLGKCSPSVRSRSLEGAIDGVFNFGFGIVGNSSDTVTIETNEMKPTFSRFASETQPETAFIVLASARELQASGKDVIELEIGDSPFEMPPNAAEAGIQAIKNGQTHYGPASGLREFREAASTYVNEEHGLETTSENIIAGPGAKTFEQLFCEAFVNPDDGVLVFVLIFQLTGQISSLVFIFRQMAQWPRGLGRCYNKN